MAWPNLQGFFAQFDNDNNNRDESDSDSEDEREDGDEAGWDDSIFRESEEELNQHRCPICINVLRDAVVLACGHNMCDPCALQLFNSRQGRRCPSCRARVRDVVPDYQTRRRVARLRVECACQRELCLEDLPKHARRCEKGSERLRYQILRRDVSRLRSRVRELEAASGLSLVLVGMIGVGLLTSWLLGRSMRGRRSGSGSSSDRRR